MAQLDKLKAAFLDCTGSYRWSDFVTMIEAMGYVKLKSGKTAGSRRKYYHGASHHKIMCHEPHDGQMGRKFVDEVRRSLQEQGLL